MELRPIKSETDYQTALGEIERLFEAKLNTPECDRLEVLTTLVEAYEKEHYPIESPDPIEAILYYLETRGLSVKDLQTYMGNEKNIAEVLSRKRALTLDIIRKLHSELGIYADILIKPYSIENHS